MPSSSIPLGRQTMSKCDFSLEILLHNCLVSPTKSRWENMFNWHFELCSSVIVLGIGKRGRLWTGGVLLKIEIYLVFIECGLWQCGEWSGYCEVHNGFVSLRSVIYMNLNSVIPILKFKFNFLHMYNDNLKLTSLKDPYSISNTMCMNSTQRLFFLDLYIQ